MSIQYRKKLNSSKSNRFQPNTKWTIIYFQFSIHISNCFKVWFWIRGVIVIKAPKFEDIGEWKRRFTFVESIFSISFCHELFQLVMKRKWILLCDEPISCLCVLIFISLPIAYHFNHISFRSCGRNEGIKKLNWKKIY